MTAIRKISEKKPRWGYRRITVQLRKGGWDVSTTRVQRLCRLHGIVVVRRQRKKGGLHVSADQPRHLKAVGPGHVWSYDLIFDTTENGKTLKEIGYSVGFKSESGFRKSFQDRFRSAPSEWTVVD